MKQLLKLRRSHMSSFKKEYVLWEDVLTALRLSLIHVSYGILTCLENANINVGIVIILSLLLDYMFQKNSQKQSDGTRGNREWPIDLLLDVGVPPDSVLGVLENLSFNDGAERSTSRRRTIAALTVYVCQKWLSESIVGGGLPFGGEEGAQAVLEILRALSDLDLLSGRDGDSLREMIESVQRMV